MKDETRIKEIGMDSFVRRRDLENYFPPILESPILKMVIPVPEGAVIQDKNYYSPSAIEHFAAKGFYPFCWDQKHEKLKVLVNENHKFPKYLIRPPDDETDGPVDELNRMLTFTTSFECYEPMFFIAVPKAFASKIKGMEQVEFAFVPKDIFDGLLPFVLDTTSIDMYKMRKRIADNQASGLITEDYDSVAADILNMILQHAVTNRATDVHIEFTGSAYRARIRVDGDLRDYPVPLDEKYYNALINVIRIRSEINVAEHFKPQDGQMQFDCAFVDKEKVSSHYDIRVSIIPQVDGKLNAVLRIQPKGEFKKLSELGFSTTVYRQISTLCSEPHGIILVTGPTGSGKTTTLYSMLNELNSKDVKIITVEDPVEIRMDGLMQVGINEKQGRTFPNMLKYFLRHDPDIILVGEIRDAETAAVAINAANTGHLVLSTLHTNDATSAVKRLGSMDKIDPADFAFSLKGVCAQRLIKMFRPDIRAMLGSMLSSKSKYDETLTKLFEKGILRKVDLGKYLNYVAGEDIFPENGIDAFEGTPEAFEGRTAITELWKVGPKAADMIFDRNFSTLGLTKVAVEDDGMLPMAYTGFEKVTTLITSPDNLLKTVGIDAIRHYNKMISKIFPIPF